MQRILSLKSRKQLVLFGQAIGRAAHRVKRGNRLIVTLNGDGDSGKSLVALAADMGVDRQSYRRGVIRKNISADMSLDAKNRPSAKTAFNNFMHRLDKTQRTFDATLDRFSRRNPDKEILIAANVERGPGRFNYGYGLQSNIQDMNLDVRTRPHTRFGREITITFDSPALLKVINEMACLTSQKAITPYRRLRLSKPRR